jgi:hypothetical protein
MNPAMNQTAVDQKLFPWFALMMAAILAVATGCRPEEANGPTAASPSPTLSPAASSASAPPSDLDSVFQAASETLYKATTPSDLAKLQPLQQVTVTQTSDGLSVQATGNDPSLLVPEFPLKPSVVKIEITSPADTALQIFFLVGPQTVYTETNSVVHRLKRGKNAVFLRIDTLNLTGKWRLDPGDALGTYVIHSVEVRAIPPPPPTPR